MRSIGFVVVTMIVLLSTGFRSAVNATDNAGYKLAYISSSDSEIWTVNSDGTDAKQITHDGGEKTGMVASPDGKTIAYYVNGYYDNATASIIQKAAVLNMATGEAQTITEEEAITGLSWSPDSHQLLFAILTQHEDFSTTYTLYVMKPDGSGQTKLGEGLGTASGLSWSPDGKQILLTEQTLNGAELFLINSDGTNKRQLTNFNNCFICYSPQWTHDSKSIVLYKHPDLFIVDADGQHVRQLTDFVPVYNVIDVFYARYGAPNFSLSSDGQTLYYTMGYPLQIVKLDLGENGWAKRTVLYESQKELLGGNLLSPDGKLLFFEKDGYLSSFDLETREVHTIATGNSDPVIVSGA